MNAPAHMLASASSSASSEEREDRLVRFLARPSSEEAVPLTVEDLAELLCSPFALRRMVGPDDANPELDPEIPF